MSIVRVVDQSAIRRRLTHDLRASLFNIDGFVKEISTSVTALERLLGDSELPDEFRSEAGRLLRDDLKACIQCVDDAATQLSERIDLLSETTESMYVDDAGE